MLMYAIIYWGDDTIYPLLGADQGMKTFETLEDADEEAKRKEERSGRECRVISIDSVHEQLMKLLTKEVLQRFEKIGSQENTTDPIVIVKFFDPSGAGTWFATEYDPDRKVFFGYVSLFNDHNNEWGSFSLDELESIRGNLGLGIERDAYGSEKTISAWKSSMQIV